MFNDRKLLTNIIECEIPWGFKDTCKYETWDDIPKFYKDKVISEFLKKNKEYSADLFGDECELVSQQFASMLSQDSSKENFIDSLYKMVDNNIHDDADSCVFDLWAENFGDRRAANEHLNEDNRQRAINLNYMLSKVNYGGVQ